MLWVADKLVHPRILTVDPPHEDMPEGVKSLYLEAARVLPDSARAAAVLIRVALQELLNHMGKSTGNLAKDIENLAKEGFDEHVIMAFNLVRLLGNDGAHPNQLMLGQTIDDAGQLFFLLNYITNTQCDRLRDRARVKELSEAIPEDVQMKIDVRHNGS